MCNGLKTSTKKCSHSSLPISLLYWSDHNLTHTVVYLASRNIWRCHYSKTQSLSKREKAWSGVFSPCGKGCWEANHCVFTGGSMPPLR